MLDVVVDHSTLKLSLKPVRNRVELLRLNVDRPIGVMGTGWRTLHTSDEQRILSIPWRCKMGEATANSSAPKHTWRTLRIDLEPVPSTPDTENGSVMPGSGQAESVARHQAIVLKPFKGEVVDGVANNVTKVRQPTSTQCSGTRTLSTRVSSRKLHSLPFSSHTRCVSTGVAGRAKF